MHTQANTNAYVPKPTLVVAVPLKPEKEKPAAGMVLVRPVN